MVTDERLPLTTHSRAIRVTTVAIERVEAPPRPDRNAWYAAGLILLACGLHLAYLAFFCPFDLAPDEAHYWQWSRHLDTAYYSKGPLIAWLIRGSCELFGNTTFAVRLPAVLCHAALLTGLFVLTARTLRSTRLALATLALALTVPPITAGAVLMTIDAPFLACWVWALVFTHRALTGSRLRDWAFAGVFCGLGLLAKFPMLLLPAALVLYLGVSRQRRSLLGQRGPWLMVAILALATLPILEWNLRHGWMEAKHVFRQVGGNGVKPFAPLAFLGGQFGFLIGYWFLAFLAAAWTFRPTVRRATGDGNFLWYFSVPVWLVFVVASTRSAGQVNWPAAAYVAGFPLAVAWVQRQITAPAPRYRRFARGCLAFAVILGSALSLAAHFPGTLLRPILVQAVSPATEKNPTPLRKLDPTCRLYGWKTLAGEIDTIRERVRRETGHDPVLAGMVWTLPGEMSFHCEGHPEAYSFGRALADRHSQYDVWHPNPVADAQVFRGRTFVYVGEEIPGMADVFDHVEPPIRVTHVENGQALATWTIWVAHGFRGFREIPDRVDY